MIDKKKICGILQETIKILDERYLIVGIGVNLKKKPNIKDYPTVNLYELIKSNIPKKKIENELKRLFEERLTRLKK